MNTFRRAATAATALSATAFALLGSVTLLTFGTSVREIFSLTIGIGA
ncbi:hypothetical protein GCM10010387_33010 [Streptomyces inusitatus]|uniref:Uncharacterized protein n=1 Tax=Streptomyces inusitatus TaxID=68221 RepID=A0A918Q6W3_9ACTN|nr:hypothetical protein [Streptomyces inusitatus]GGZ36349.1 hypothetical protein GCM10010387_33010 [Streptomyces inusitatus]